MTNNAPAPAYDFVTVGRGAAVHVRDAYGVLCASTVRPGSSYAYARRVSGVDAPTCKRCAARFVPPVEVEAEVEVVEDAVTVTINGQEVEVTDVGAESVEVRRTARALTRASDGDFSRAAEAAALTASDAYADGDAEAGDHYRAVRAAILRRC